MKFNICIVGQRGRLEYEALLFMTTFRQLTSSGDVSVYVCTPVDSSVWTSNPDMRGTQIAERLVDLGARIVHFENERFGSRYPHSNKIYALGALPAGEPFLFLDTDHVVLSDLAELKLDFHKPTGAFEVHRWPVPEKSRYTREQIWTSLYRMFDLPTKGWFRDIDDPDVNRRYPYFNAGSYYYLCPQKFLRIYRHVLHRIHDDPPEELENQRMFPWLDQISLPIVMNFLGGDPTEYTDDYILNRWLFHYFTMGRLYVNLRHGLLPVWDERLICASEHTSVFREQNTIDHYFFGSGGEEIDRLIEDEGMTPRNFAAIRIALKARGQWKG